FSPLPSLLHPTAPTQIYTLSLHDALPISTGAVSLDHASSIGAVSRDGFGLRSAAPTRVRDLRIDDDVHEARPGCGQRALATSGRSEEHTSELQSRGHLVCRLLLEKKKKKI